MEKLKLELIFLLNFFFQMVALRKVDPTFAIGKVDIKDKNGVLAIGR